MSCSKFLLSSFLFYAIFSISLENTLREDIMYIMLGEEKFTINLVQSETTRELISILPSKTSQIEKDSTKIQMKLKYSIETTSLLPVANASIKGNRGDVFLYQEKEIIILNEQTTFENAKGEFIKIGTCENVEELLNKIEKNKTILLWNTLNYENNKGKVKPYGRYYSIMNFFTWKILSFFCFLFI